MCDWFTGTYVIGDWYTGTAYGLFKLKKKIV